MTLLPPRPNGRPPLIALLLFALAPWAWAHLPPTDEEIKDLRSKGLYDHRLGIVESMDNSRFSRQVFARAKQKLTRVGMQARGLPATSIASLAAAPPPDWRGLPTTGSPRVPTILIDFPDHLASTEFPAVSPSDIWDNIYGTGTAAAKGHMPFNSVADFYRRASQGRLDIRGNVLGFFTMPDNQFDYAPSQSDPDNQKLFDIVTEALQAFDATHDFSQYDNNNDGYIDGINVIWVGQGGAWSSFWWAYRWRFYVPAVETTLFDGKKLSWFTWQRLDTRNSGTDFDPQTLIHETGHLLGMPDLYDYKRGQGLEGGVGGLDVMDANVGNPNAFFRWMLDWITPEVVSAGGPVSHVLRASGDTDVNANQAVAIFPDAARDPFQEFFLMENRHRVGNDGGESRLPSDGLVVWHVDATLTGDGSDFAYNNNDRPTTAHKLVRLVQADGLEEVESGGRADAGDYFNQGETLTPSSFPNTASYAGTTTDIGLSGISANGVLMTADIGFLSQGDQPDLRDRGPAFHGLSDTSRQPGQSLTLSGSVENGGPGNAGSFVVTYFLSTDGQIDGGDILIGQETLAGLAGGATASLSLSVTLPLDLAAGDYSVGWILDAGADVGESDESNNTVALAPPLTIVAAASPDIQILGAGFVIASGDAVPRPLDGTDFQGVLVGDEQSRTFAIVNRGTAPLLLGSPPVSLAGPGQDHFTVESQPGSPVEASGSTRTVIAFRPTLPGRHTATVRVAGDDPDTPEYTFAVAGTGLSANDDHGNDTGSATLVTTGSATGGLIENGGDEDFFRIDLPQSGTLRVYSTGGTDTLGQLLGGSGSLLQEDDDTGDGLNFDIRLAVAAGPHYVRIRGYDSTISGAYTLHVEFTPGTSFDDHADTLVDATAIGIDATVSGVLETTGDLDIFVLNIPTNGVVTAESSGNTDTYGLFLTPAGIPLAEDDDSGVDRNFRLEAEVGAGLVYLAVEGYDDTVTGAYTVRVRFEPTILTDDHGDGSDDATVLSSNDLAVGRLEQAGDVDVFAILVPQAGTLNAFTIGDTDTLGFLSGVPQADDEGPGFNFEVDAYVPSAGTYHLEVTGFDNTVGDYVLVTHFLPSLVNEADDHWNGPHDFFATPIAAGVFTSGWLEQADDNDYFVIEVPEPGVLEVQTSGLTDTLGYLLDTEGLQIQINDDRSTVDRNFRLVQEVSAGLHYIRVQGYQALAVGAYSLLATFTPGVIIDDHGNDTVSATPVGETSDTAGSLEIGGDADFFRFTLGDARIVSLNTTGFTDTFGTLFDADGRELASNDDPTEDDLNFEISRTLPAGTYYIRVRGYDAAILGPYTLSLRSDPAPVPLRITSLARTGPNGVDITFPADAARQYSIWFSTDLDTWNVLLPGLQGTGAPQTTPLQIPPDTPAAALRIQRD